MIPENVKMEIIIYFQIENVKLKVEILPLIVKFNCVILLTLDLTFGNQDVVYISV